MFARHGTWNMCPSLYLSRGSTYSSLILPMWPGTRQVVGSCPLCYCVDQEPIRRAGRPTGGRPPPMPRTARRPGRRRQRNVPFPHPHDKFHCAFVAMRHIIDPWIWISINTARRRETCEHMPRCCRSTTPTGAGASRARGLAMAVPGRHDPISAGDARAPEETGSVRRHVPGDLAVR
jgi:hypothetical protein